MFWRADGRRISGGDRGSGGQPVSFPGAVFFCTGGTCGAVFSGGKYIEQGFREGE